MDYYGHKLFNGVLFAHHLILDVPGGSPHLGYRRRVPLWHNPPTRVLRGIVNYVACASNFFLKICVCVQLSVADLFPVAFGEQRGSHCARATRLIFPALDHTRQSDLTRIEI